MAFERKTWLDRQTEYPGRRKLTATATADVYDVTREEGLIVEEGDALNAQNLNGLEGRIEAGLEEKADASHTHAPGDLTEPVPESKGGTGQASLAEVTVGNAQSLGGRSSWEYEKALPIYYSSRAVYVNTTTGNDSNDGASQSSPKKTIQAAVDSMPYNLAGQIWVVWVYGGSYTASGYMLTDSGHTNGEIFIDGRYMDEGAVLTGDFYLTSDIGYGLYQLSIVTNNQNTYGAIAAMGARSLTVINCTIDCLENSSTSSRSAIRTAGDATTFGVSGVDFKNCFFAVNTQAESTGRRGLCTGYVVGCTGDNVQFGIRPVSAVVMWDWKAFAASPCSYAGGTTMMNLIPTARAAGDGFLRNISFTATDLAAGTSSLADNNVVLVYE